MHSSHAAFMFRELYRQELLAYVEQERLVDLACVDRPPASPGAALAAAILAFVHRVSACKPLARGERRSTSPAPAAADASPPLIAHHS